MCACEVCLSVVCLSGSFSFDSISTEIFLHCAVIVFSKSAYVCLVHCVYFCVVCSCAVCVSVVCMSGRCNFFSISAEISLQCPFIVFSQSAYVSGFLQVRENWKKSGNSMWSGKGQGKIYFWKSQGKVREKIKMK